MTDPFITWALAGREEEEEQDDFLKYALGEVPEVGADAPKVGTGRSFGPGHYNYNRVDPDALGTGASPSTTDTDFVSYAMQDDMTREEKLQQIADAPDVNRTPGGELDPLRDSRWSAGETNKVARRKFGRDVFMRNPLEMYQMGTNLLRRGAAMAMGDVTNAVPDMESGLGGFVQDALTGDLEPTNPLERIWHAAGGQMIDDDIARKAVELEEKSVEDFADITAFGTGPAHSLATLQHAAGYLVDPWDVVGVGAMGKVGKAMAKAGGAADAGAVGAKFEQSAGKAAAFMDVWKVENPHAQHGDRLIEFAKARDEMDEAIQGTAARLKEAQVRRQLAEDVWEAELATDGGRGIARRPYHIIEQSVRDRLHESDPEILKIISEEQATLAAERVTPEVLKDALGGKGQVWGGGFDDGQTSWMANELIRLGATKLEYLGRGGFSNVFDIGNGRIAKVSHYQLTDPPTSKAMVDDKGQIMLDPLGRVREEQGAPLRYSQNEEYEPYIHRSSFGDAPGKVDEGPLASSNYVEIGIQRKLDTDLDSLTNEALDVHEAAYEGLLDKGIHSKDLQNRGGQIGTNPWTGERTLVDHMPESTTLDDAPQVADPLPGDARKIGKNAGRRGAKQSVEPISDPLESTRAALETALREAPGVGPAKAEELLSGDLSALQKAINEGDLAALRKMGIGKASANNLVVRWRGKLKGRMDTDLGMPALEQPLKPGTPDAHLDPRVQGAQAASRERKARARADREISEAEAEMQALEARARQVKRNRDAAKENQAARRDTRTATQRGAGKVEDRGKVSREHPKKVEARENLAKAKEARLLAADRTRRLSAKIEGLERARFYRTQEAAKRGEELDGGLAAWFTQRINREHDALAGRQADLQLAVEAYERAKMDVDAAAKLKDPEVKIDQKAESAKAARIREDQIRQGLKGEAPAPAQPTKGTPEPIRGGFEEELDGLLVEYMAARNRRAAARAEKEGLEAFDHLELADGTTRQTGDLYGGGKGTESVGPSLEGTDQSARVPRKGSSAGPHEPTIPGTEPRIKQEDMRLEDPLADAELRERVARRAYPQESARQRVMAAAIDQGQTAQGTLHRLVQRLDLAVTKATTQEGAVRLMQLRDRLSEHLDMSYGKIADGNVRLIYDGHSFPDALDVVPLRPKQKKSRLAAAQAYADLMGRMKAVADEVPPTQLEYINGESLGLKASDVIAVARDETGKLRVVHATSPDAWREAFKLAGRDPKSLAHLEPGDLHHLDAKGLRQRHSAVWKLMEENGLGPWKKENAATQLFQQQALDAQARLTRGQANSPKEGRILRGEINVDLENYNPQKLERPYETLTEEERQLHDLHRPMQVEQVESIRQEVEAAGHKITEYADDEVPIRKGKVRRLFAEWFTRTKGLPREVFESVVTRDRVVNAVRNVAQRNAETLEKNLRSWANTEGIPLEEAHERVYALMGGLGGNPESVQRLARGMPQELVDAALVARKHVDTLTLATIAEFGDALSPEMVRTMRGNLGSYLIRQYEAQARGWDAIDPHVPARNGGRGGELGSQSWQDTVQWMMGQNPDLDWASASDELFAFMQRGKHGNWDPGLILKDGPDGIRGRQLKKRAELPKSAREILGESFDPMMAYFETVMRMTQDLETHRMYARMKEMGAGKYFFAKPTGGAATQVTDPLAGASPLEHRRQMAADSVSEKNEFAKMVSRGADDFIPQLGPLDGMFTYDWLDSAMHRYNMAVSAPMNRAYRAIMGVNGAIKVGKTVGGLAPSMARNFFSAMGTAVMGGTNPLNFPRLLKAAKLTNPVRRGMGPVKGAEMKALHSKLVKLGVLGDGANYGEFMFHASLAKEAGLLGKAGKALDAVVPNLKRMATRTWDATKQAYAAGDDFWKAVTYLDELNRARKMNPGMGEEALELLAARLTTERMPTYSQVPDAVNLLKKQPVFGSFVSFPSEILRSTKNNMKHIIEAERAGNYMDAARRSAGMFSVLAAPSALVAGAVMWAQRDPSQPGYELSPMEKWAKDSVVLAPLLPPWNQTSQRPMVKTGPDTFVYWATNNYDPYSMLKEPVQAAFLQGMQTKDPQAAEIVAAMGEGMLEQFIGWDVGFQGLVNVATNRKGGNASILSMISQNNEKGATVTDAASPEARARDQFLYLLDHYAPAVEGSARRLGYALVGEEINHQKQSLPREALNWMTGVRLIEVDVPTAMTFEGRRLKSSFQQMQRAYKREIAETGGDPGKALEVRQRYRGQFEQRMVPQVRNLVEAARYHGYDDNRIGQILSSPSPIRVRGGEAQNGAAMQVEMVRRGMFPDRYMWNPF